MCIKLTETYFNNQMVTLLNLGEPTGFLKGSQHEKVGLK